MRDCTITIIYFIRHAKSDYNVREDRTRPLTEKGLIDRCMVTKFLLDKNIDVVLSSPYKRAIDTLIDFTTVYGFTIEIIEDFREAEDNNKPLKEENSTSVMKYLWEDLNHKIIDDEWENVESLFEVQERNINALNDVLMRYKEKNIVIGTHGVALSTIINYYDNSFAFEDFMAMVDITPWVVKMSFYGTKCNQIEIIDLFTLSL